MCVLHSSVVFTELNTNTLLDDQGRPAGAGRSEPEVGMESAVRCSADGDVPASWRRLLAMYLFNRNIGTA
jgi:hypothetical protein